MEKFGFRLKTDSRIIEFFGKKVETNEETEENENNRLLNLIGLQGQEEGSTTGRKRQVNWLNLDELKKALLINNCNFVVINKCDIIKMCNNNKGKI